MSRLSRAESCYAALLRLYPAAYRHRFETQMRQTFRDLYRDQSRHGVVFWTRLALDTFTGATREQATVTRSLDMHKITTMSANQRALYAGLVLMLPAVLFVAVGTGLQIMPPHHYLGQELHLPLHLMQIMLVAFPLLALAINLAALVGTAARRRQSLLSFSFIKRYLLTLVLLAVALGWLAVLFGHDTIGCAAQNLPLLHWQAFRHCAAAH